uniref:hypothetical protein n=1 Tax=Amycolatopsis sp. CA-096443 TaxID=3239919 RepID=UPI003F4938FA
MVAGRLTREVGDGQRAALAVALTTRLAGEQAYLGTAGSPLAYGNGPMLDLSPAAPLVRWQGLVRDAIRETFGPDAGTWRQGKAHISTHYCHTATESDEWQRRLRRIDPAHAPVRIREVAIVDVRPDPVLNELRYAVLDTIPLGQPLPAHRLAAAARADADLAQADFDRLAAEISQAGDSADYDDAAALKRARLDLDEAVARWHACAPAGPTAWWPGGWRLAVAGEVQYGYPAVPWPTREAVDAAIAAATPDQTMLRIGTPTWIALDHAGTDPHPLNKDLGRTTTGPIGEFAADRRAGSLPRALDVDYWSTQDR